MINAVDFRRYVVDPALAALAPAGIPITQTAANLLMATAAIESALGLELVQEEGGPALGVFMIEPPSLADLLAWLHPPHRTALAMLATPEPPVVQIVTNLRYAAAICRLFYWRVLDPLPPNTVSGLWSYYKPFWNSAAGASTLPEFQSALKIAGLSGLPA